VSAAAIPSFSEEVASNGLDTRLEYRREPQLVLAREPTDEIQNQRVEFEDLCAGGDGQKIRLAECVQYALALGLGDSGMVVINCAKHLFTGKALGLTACPRERIDNVPVFVQIEDESARCRHGSGSFRIPVA